MIMSEDKQSDSMPRLVRHVEVEQYDPCEGCGDGDKVPASGYFRCPVCDAEWSDDGDDSLPHTQDHTPR